MVSPEEPVAESPRRRAAHLGPERRRPLILDAALEVFSERGYAGTTMQAVADAARSDEAGGLRLLLQPRRAPAGAAGPRGAAPGGLDRRRAAGRSECRYAGGARARRSDRLPRVRRQVAAVLADRLRRAVRRGAGGVQPGPGRPCLPGRRAPPDLGQIVARGHRAGREPAGAGRDARLDDRELRPAARRRRHRPHPGRAGRHCLPDRRRWLRFRLVL
ncbi:helix-turn-helix transcriptional regulator [Kribbella qitaiheensis]|uniref:Helix-turn-helix transcriptional regulator n=1 Tax=Kribbella qitaiheensis TaxID=1544730 RepID=A0A7G6X3V0_9ACTN|nr:helix-turn-helix transcriptional regulator [Kribbella qitaiheensis]